MLRRTLVGVSSAIILASSFAARAPHAQVAADQAGLVVGRNVNMVSGLEWPGGDPFLQRQNEPSVAASTRNPLHMLGGANDYRSVDLPGMPDDEETGDAWLGVFKSFDGGDRWQSNLIPGYPQDQSPEGLASPLKAYKAAADPVVRAGTNGLFYYSGLVFNRGDNDRSAVFVARYIDNNNVPGGDPIAYLGASVVASDDGATGAFLDKPWLAVDVPRAGAQTCEIPTDTPGAPPQEIRAGAVYLVFTSITGEGSTLRSEIRFSRSADCGVTWTHPVRISRPQDDVNQGASIAIDPRTGDLYVTWRRFSLGSGNDEDAIMVARSVSFGRKFDPPGVARRFPRGRKLGLLLDRLFEHRHATRQRPNHTVAIAEVAGFDQGTSAADVSFRTNTYPTMTFDDQGRLYVAWAERGFASARPDPIDGDARIVLTTSKNGNSWTPPRAVEDSSEPGHQIMPTLAFAGGRLVLAYYDLREDRSQLFTKYVDDKTAATNPVVAPPKRHTIDIRAALGTPGPDPVFQPSVRVSEYRIGSRPRSSPPPAGAHLVPCPGSTEPAPDGQPCEQLQVNPPNLPMFKQGTVPFVGDYIDVAPSPAFVPLPNGRWAYNTSGPVVFHAVWTDNRDVRVPPDGDWTHYAPPISPYTSQTCTPGFAASRNQNIYTSRLTTGLIVGSPGNTRPLSATVPHSFVVFAQNTTDQPRSFRFTILGQPAGGWASFDQFASPPLTVVDATLPPRSMASRTVYVTAADPRAQVPVDVSEIAAPGAPGVLPNGLGGRILLNPDVENPDVENPDVENFEVLTPDVENPDVENPDVENPDVENPDVENPDVENVVLANPDVENLSVGAPDVENPDVENPDVENPDVENPDVENGTLTDVTWTAKNTGNTTAAYKVNLFLSQAAVPQGIRVQLILHKIYTTPIAQGCDLKTETRNVLVENIVDPDFITSSTPALRDQNDPSEKNAVLWLAPGEEARITLRIYDPDKSNNVVVNGASIDPAFVPETGVSLLVQQQAVDTAAMLAGETEPPVVTPSGATVFFVQQPTTGVVGTPLAPPVTVQVRDTTGTVVAGAQVTLALGANPGGATLAGGGPLPTGLDGIATFASLSLDRVGIGYTLVASAAAPGVVGPPVESSHFAVFEACAADGTARLQHYYMDHDVPAGPIALAGSGDFDGDHFADPVVLARTGTGGVFYIMTNNGLGGFRWTFAAPVGPGTSGPAAVAVGDFNADGYSDITIANELSDYVSVLLGQAGSPPVGAPTTVAVTDGPKALATGDFDHDGYVDLAVGGDGARVTILRGSPSGLTAFADLVPGGVDARGLAVADFNGDNRPDLAVADPGTSGVGILWVYLNLGGGTFGTPTQYHVGESVAVVAADFNGDHRPDLAVGNANGEVRVLVNDGTGFVTAGPPVALPTNLRSIAAGDFDNDGDQDVAVAPGVVGEDRFFLLFGDGGGGLSAPTSFDAGPAPWAVLAADFNQDGRTDLALANHQRHDLDGSGTTYLTMSVLLGNCRTATADLAVTFTAPPDPSPLGGNITYTATVTNNGPFPATGVSLTQALTASGSPPAFVSATPSAGTCSAALPLSCDLGTLAAGAAATVTLVVTPTSTGTLRSDWMARAAELDTSPLDNTRWAFVDIEDPFVVTTTSDSGLGSLRYAIQTANARPGPNAISFDIPGTGPHTIAPTSALPTITDPVTIDGLSQPGAAPGALLIELSGASAGPGVDGLVITAGGGIVRGLVINRFAHGIMLLGGSSTIAGNYLGTDVTGMAARANTDTGVAMLGSSNNVIGGASPADHNLISGNAGAGVSIRNSSGNAVKGNYLGTDAAGAAAIPNLHGVFIWDAPNNTVGGTAPGEGNVISGNNEEGVVISQVGATGNLVAGNFIGTDPTGTVALGNIQNGVYIDSSSGNTVGGTSTGARNVITGNLLDGVLITQGTGDASNNHIEGNYIGLGDDGSAVGNGKAGVHLSTSSVLPYVVTGNVIGGSAPGAGNVISANEYGVALDQSAVSNNRVEGNLVGIDPTGSFDRGNTWSGILVDEGAASNTIRGNVVSGNDGDGITLSTGATGTVVENNLVGVAADGETRRANAESGVSLDGAATTGNMLSGNTIAGNNVDGVNIRNGAHDNTVTGNFLGTNPGHDDIGNVGGGVRVENASYNVIGVPGAGNVISDNGIAGIILQGADHNTVQANSVGFNGGAGVVLGDSVDNLVGGDRAAGEDNVISGNNGAGIAVTGTSLRNQFSENAISNNGGLGIDLVGGTEDSYGVTANDATDPDTGPNDLLNYPILMQAVVSGSTTTVTGTLNSVPGTTFRIEFFSSPACDASGHGEGLQYLGSADVAPTDGGGDTSFKVSFPVALTLGHQVTATTNTLTATSEFSACVVVGS